VDNGGSKALAGRATVIQPPFAIAKPSIAISIAGSCEPGIDGAAARPGGSSSAPRTNTVEDAEACRDGVEAGGTKARRRLAANLAKC